MDQAGRKQNAKSAGKHGNQRLSPLAEGAVDYAILMLDPSGVVVSWNAGAERIKGYRASEIIGQHFSCFYTEEDRKADQPRRALREAVEGGRHEAEGWRVRKDGTCLFANVVIDAIRDENGILTGFASVTCDVTERRKSQQVDQQLTMLVRAVVDYAIFLLDTSGNVVTWNAGAERIKGYSADDIIGQNFSRFYTEEDRRSGRPQHALREAEQHGRYEAEGWRVRKDGTRFFANVVLDAIRDETGTLTGFGKITRDITQRMKEQQTLIESEHMVRDIIGMSLDAFIQTDEEGSVLEWNAQAENLFGRPRAEALGQKLSALIISAELRAGFWAGIERLVQTREAPVIGSRLEMEALRRDGRRIKIELAITALRRREGYVFNAFIRDLTERDAIEAQLRQAQKLEALGQLTGGVAHDFNNLLTVVVGNIEMLLRRIKPVATANGDLGVPANAALRAANRAAMLTRQLLAFARQQTLQPRPTDLAALARTTVALLRRTLGEGIAIDTRLGNGIGPVVVDPNQLENALLNLALNARDAMPEGGRLLFEVMNVTIERARRALPEDIPPGEYAVISVIDTGAGMSEDVLAHVFEPFFTTKEVGRGSGLGLSQVYGFMQQSGGRVAIASAPGAGTTVSLFLPRGNAAVPQSDVAVRARAPAAGREKILVVEDDDDVRRFTTGTLRELGYDVLEASHGDEALRLLDRHSDTRLLFSDIGLPGRLNGRQLAEEAMRRADGLRVLFTSGYGEATLVEKGRLVAGVALISKPFTYADLGTKVRQVLDT